MDRHKYPKYKQALIFMREEYYIVIRQRNCIDYIYMMFKISYASCVIIITIIENGDSGIGRFKGRSSWL